MWPWFFRYPSKNGPMSWNHHQIQESQSAFVAQKSFWSSEKPSLLSCRNWFGSKYLNHHPKRLPCAKKYCHKKNTYQIATRNTKSSLYRSAVNFLIFWSLSPFKSGSCNAYSKKSLARLFPKCSDVCCFSLRLCKLQLTEKSVDGNPKQPPGRYKTLQIVGETRYELVQDFFHQQYCIRSNSRSYKLCNSWLYSMPWTYTYIYVYIYIEGTTSPISLQCSEFQTACVGKPTELQDLPHHRLSLDLGNSTNDGRKTPVIFASQKIAAKESQIKTQTAGTVAAVQECP